MKTVFKNIAILLAILLVEGMAKDAPSYSAKPYQKPVLDDAEYLVRLMYTNNRIVETNINPQDSQKVREDLYVLIDGWVKKHYPSSIQEFPGTPRASNDLMGPGYLFRLADRLNVWSAKLVAEALDTSIHSPVRAITDINGFSARLDGPLLTIKSARQPWSVAVPYHFMPGIRRRVMDNFGYETEMLAVSTGYAKQEAKPGFSQATIILVVSKRRDTEKFASDWENVYRGRSASEPCYWTLSNFSCKALEKLGGSDVKGNLYFGSHGEYSILVAYLGLPETFRENLPHGRDFIQAISWND